MKKLLFFFLVFFQITAYAREAMVIVFQASLYKEKNDTSTVLQNIRKGNKVYVPASLDLTKPLPEYIETFDWTGNTAYIKSNHIKIVTNDDLEKKWPISIGKHDPTDYRIEEPIPPTYPFWDHSFGRASLEFTMGGNSQPAYNYGSSFAKQDYAMEKGVKFSLSKKVSFDNTDRIYYGFILGYSYVKNAMSSLNDVYASEIRTLIRIGPYLSYDAFRSQEYRFSLGIGATYNFHRTSIYLNDAHDFFDYSEERIFGGTSISPMTSIGLQMDKVIPGASLLMGSDVYFYLPYKQTAPKKSTYPEIWKEEQISSSLRAQISFFLGVQLKY